MKFTPPPILSYFNTLEMFVSAWWENRIDQPGTQYHFVIIGKLFLRCNALRPLLMCAKARSP